VNILGELRLRDSREEVYEFMQRGDEPTMLETRVSKCISMVHHRPMPVQDRIKIGPQVL